MSRNRVQQAFPIPSGLDDGMTLRDYFAAQALAGIVTGFAGDADHHAEHLAQMAYAVADAMMEKREKP